MSEEEEKRNPQGFGAYLKYREKGTTNFVLMNESRFWDTTDLHAKAFENIRPAYGPDKKPTNLAGQMQDILSQTPSRMDKGYRVEAAAECLTCHASVQPAGRASPLAAKRPEHFLTEGVSCEACHGDGRKWFFEHTDETWREVPGAKKQAEYGQIDLRDPYTRTLKCASCHIGNKAEGKFVTATDLGLSIAVNPPTLNLRVVRQNAETAAIRQALVRASGNISRTAELLGITRPTLYDLMGKYGIRADAADVSPAEAAAPSKSESGAA